jgi:hypothetical protein
VTAAAHFVEMSVPKVSEDDNELEDVSSYWSKLIQPRMLCTF